MRVAVDATSLLDVRTGVGYFTEALLRGLGSRSDIDVTAFPVSLRGRGGLRDAVPPGVDVVAPPFPATALRSTWRRYGRPRIDLAIGRHDVVHGPNFVVPPSRAGRVMSVHDLTPVRFPDLCHRDTLAYPELIRRAARDGAWVHTDSDAVRSEVIDMLGVDADRVVTVPLGFTPMAGGDASNGRRLAGCSAAPAGSGGEGFALAVGTIEPRKDLPSLLRAIDALAGDGTEIPLVHVGPEGWGAEAFERALGQMARPDLVTRLGRVPVGQLRDLYAAARVVVYPSVYEGFGLPVLEAMSAGVPVVSTTVPAIREVAGRAAALVPVGDVDALASAVAWAWTDEAERQRMVDEGLRQSASFSWDSCLDGIVSLYRRVTDAEPR